MKAIPGKLYAVLTGDVVKSSKLPPEQRRRLPKVMKECSDDVRAVYPAEVRMDADLFRGDSWQLLVMDPALSVRIGLFFRASLRKRMKSGSFDTRIAIGVGTADFLSPGRVSEGSGEAFRNSGHALEAMKKHRMGFSFPGSASEESCDVVVKLIDALAMKWTERQSRAMIGALQGWTQEQIAHSWGRPKITQQAASLHLESGNWRAVETGLLYCESMLRSAPHD